MSVRWQVSVGALSTILGVSSCAADGSSDSSPSSGGGGTASTSSGTGGDSLEDIPCTNQNGCVRGHVTLALTCSAPDDGMGATQWDASVDLSLTESSNNAGCTFLPAWDGNGGFLALGFGAVDEDGGLISDVPFDAAGTYHLGGGLSSYQFALRANGGRGGGTSGTFASTQEPCSPGCELDILPHGRTLTPGAWTTLRFVVTCAQPLGIPEFNCGQCSMAPSSFQLDAACFSQLPMQ